MGVCVCVYVWVGGWADRSSGMCMDASHLQVHKYLPVFSPEVVLVGAEWRARGLKCLYSEGPRADSDCQRSCLRVCRTIAVKLCLLMKWSRRVPSERVFGGCLERPRGSERVDTQVADSKRYDLTLEKHRAQRVLRASFFCCCCFEQPRSCLHDTKCFKRRRRTKFQLVPCVAYP